MNSLLSGWSKFHCQIHFSELFGSGLVDLCGSYSVSFLSKAICQDVTEKAVSKPEAVMFDVYFLGSFIFESSQKGSLPLFRPCQLSPSGCCSGNERTAQKTMCSLSHACTVFSSGLGDPCQCLLHQLALCWVHKETLATCLKTSGKTRVSILWGKWEETGPEVWIPLWLWSTEIVLVILEHRAHICGAGDAHQSVALTKLWFPSEAQHKTGCGSAQPSQHCTGRSRGIRSSGSSLVIYWVEG